MTDNELSGGDAVLMVQNLREKLADVEALVRAENEQKTEARARIAALEAEIKSGELLTREIDLLFGRMLLGMRAAVIEEEHGKGADAAMAWIVNGLVGPGELPPEGATDAQAYFDHEVKAIDEGMRQIMEERKTMSSSASAAPVAPDAARPAKDGA